MRLLSSVLRRLLENKCIGRTDMMMTHFPASGDSLDADLDGLRTPHCCTLVIQNSLEGDLGASKREGSPFRENMPSPKNPSLPRENSRVLCACNFKQSLRMLLVSFIFPSGVVASEPKVALTR